MRHDGNHSSLACVSANTETWNYNPKGEVVSADHSTNNAFDRSFEFDGIGNRKKSADSLTLPASDNYTSNALNQYSAVGVDTRLFDEDGNLLSDSIKQYVWDAENRLIEVKNAGGTIATYAYDYKSRRITKTVGSTETNFVYNAWNPIAEFSGTTLSKSYTWGMDLSGSMQGAGGVGGLLAVNDTAATYYPTMDGNGNISEYLNATGTSVAHYKYDTFGQVEASGTKANDFSHQFSTKQLDSESGLHYYGYRYYDSSNGRWLARDSIGENGGLNVFGFVRNNAVGRVDLLGLNDCTHTIKVAHFKTDEGSNWDHFTSDENDGRTCYVGCGMNYLNDQQSTKFPNISAGILPIPKLKYDFDSDGYLLGSNNGYYEAEPKDFPDDYSGPDVIDKIDKGDVPANIDRKIEEIGSEKCKRYTPCCKIEISIECQERDDPRCGTTVSYDCNK